MFRMRNKNKREYGPKPAWPRIEPVTLRLAGRALTGCFLNEFRSKLYLSVNSCSSPIPKNPNSIYDQIGSIESRFMKIGRGLIPLVWIWIQYKYWLPVLIVNCERSSCRMLSAGCRIRLIDWRCSWWDWVSRKFTLGVAYASLFLISIESKIKDWLMLRSWWRNIFGISQINGPLIDELIVGFNSWVDWDHITVLTFIVLWSF